MLIQLFIAFVIGGILCGLAQIILDITNRSITIIHILVGYVITGALLSSIGLYEFLVDFAGAGALIPLSGFGHLLAQGAIQGSHKLGLVGAFTGPIETTAAIITATIVFSYLFAVLSDPRGD